jgi:hypothetical protein
VGIRSYRAGLDPQYFDIHSRSWRSVGLLWLALGKSLPNQAGWISGLLALLVHNFANFNDLFIEAPLVAMEMEISTAVIWGLPLTILTLRRDIDSAIAYHWIQDVARFLVGF